MVDYIGCRRAHATAFDPATRVVELG